MPIFTVTTLMQIRINGKVKVQMGYGFSNNNFKRCGVTQVTHSTALTVSPAGAKLKMDIDIVFLASKSASSCPSYIFPSISIVDG